VLVDRPALGAQVAVQVEQDRAPGDREGGGVVDAEQVVAGYEAARVRAVVEAVLGVADVPEPVELGAVLGVEAVQPFVAVERRAGEDVVLDGAAGRGERGADGRRGLVERENAVPSRTSPAAARRSFRVSRLSVPSWSSAPNRPQLEPGGASVRARSAA